MIIYVYDTISLGDFLNSMPVLSGIAKNVGNKINLLIRPEMERFNGILELLRYQSIFNSVHFVNQNPHDGKVYMLSSVTREDKNFSARPTETCRYENHFRDNYNISFDVDDDFILEVPTIDIEIKDTYYVGDRWTNNSDSRRTDNNLTFLDNVEFVNYNNSLMINTAIIKNLRKPFITTFTGIAVIADLMNVDSYVVWKPEIWAPEYRNGDNILWDGGKNIDQVFAKHFYLNRKSKLVHKLNLLEKLV